MSCGNPHETPCAEVDAHLDEFLDHELSPADIALLKKHFEECPPCLGKLRIAQKLKERIARACAGAAPTELRQRVMRRITEIRANGVKITVEETHIISE